MENDENLELIRKYLRKELSEQELGLFNQLNSSREFMEKLTEFKLFHDLFEMDSLYEETKALLSDIAIHTYRDSYSNVIKVAIVDDHKLFRKELKELIDNFSGYQVEWEASNGRQCIEKLSSVSIPDIILVDTHMPEMNGYETVVWLRKNYPQISILAMTLTEDDILEKMLEAGTDNYILKNAAPIDLKKILNSITRQELYNAGLVAGTLFKNTQIKAVKSDSDDLSKFTQREIEIIKLTCNEYTSKEISNRLNISLPTFSRYRKNIYSKTGVKDKLGLVMYALKNGLIDPH